MIFFEEEMGGYQASLPTGADFRNFLYEDLHSATHQ